VTAGRIDPGNTHQVTCAQTGNSCAAGLHPANNLVARNNWKTGRRCPPLYLVEFGMTNTAGQDPEQHFTGSGNGDWAFSQDKWLVITIQLGDSPEFLSLHI